MIANAWTLTALGEVLTHRNSYVAIDDRNSYKRCRVQLNARGIVLRDKVLGVEIKTKDQQVCRTGDFLVAEIDAKLGGFGIVPESLDGAIVSSHYFLFEVAESRLRRAFLNYCIRTPQFQEQVRARGSTNYAAIRPHHVLEYAIPLPDPDEQDRIVAKLDAVATRQHEAASHFTSIEGEAQAMLRSAFERIVSGAPRRPMSEVAPLVRRSVEITLGGEYAELGIRSFGRGTFHKPSLDYWSVGTKNLYRIEPGDLLFNNVFAWEGAIAVARREDAGRVGSHRFITCLPSVGVVTADFLCFYFLTPEGLERIGKASPGGAGRNRTLGLDKLAAIEVPVPPIEHQRWFDRLQDKVRELRFVLTECTTDLNAMMPAILDHTFSGTDS